jgi:hydroxymethylpyrimidine kinase/phosphomethylpyrimidine kinase/thiamine-phosphate diphosphorylase
MSALMTECYIALCCCLALFPTGEGHTITSVQDMEAAAQHLHSWGCQTVLIKGGHLAERMQQQQQQGTDPSDAIMQVVDVLYDGQQFHYFAAPHINTSNTHGTGCTLAAAIATALAAGSTPVQAVAAAKGYLTASLAASSTLNLGQGPQHPFNHGFGLSSVTGLLNPVEAQAAALQGLGAHVLNPVDLRVYVVTDAGCNERAGRSLMEAVAGAVAGGATIVQLREKDIDGGDFLKEARAIVEVRVCFSVSSRCCVLQLCSAFLQCFMCSVSSRWCVLQSTGVLICCALLQLSNSLRC